MELTEDTLVAFYSNLITLEERAKEFTDDIKKAKKAFCSCNNIKLKSIAGNFKAYKEFLKNQTEFIETDIENDKLTRLFVPQYQDKE
jgi:hypothetical protein